MDVFWKSIAEHQLWTISGPARSHVDGVVQDIAGSGKLQDYDVETIHTDEGLVTSRIKLIERSIGIDHRLIFDQRPQILIVHGLIHRDHGYDDGYLRDIIDPVV